MKKVVITDKIIWDIKDLAQQDFRNERNLSRFSGPEMQIYLILRGLERFLLRDGHTVPFEIPMPAEEDSLPIDDSGLDIVVEEVKQ